MAREVDRLLAGLANLGTGADSDHRPRSGVPTPVTVSGRGAPHVARRTQGPTRADHVALWARVLLGAVLGGMMTQWPYPNGCGLPLVEYLGAVAMVMVAGGWIAVVSWRLRNAPCHVLALLLLLWGIALAAGQVLPRIGYAAQRWSWQCVGLTARAARTSGSSAADRTSDRS
jgi:hypothetical protein